MHASATDPTPSLSASSYGFWNTSLYPCSCVFIRGSCVTGCCYPCLFLPTLDHGVCRLPVRCALAAHAVLWLACLICLVHMHPTASVSSKVAASHMRWSAMCPFDLCECCLAGNPRGGPNLVGVGLLSLPEIISPKGLWPVWATSFSSFQSSLSVARLHCWTTWVLRMNCRTSIAGHIQSLPDLMSRVRHARLHC